MEMLIDTRKITVKASSANNEVQITIVAAEGQDKKSMVLHLSSTEATVLATALKEERAKLAK